jgi:hypothetical protein
MEITLKKKEKQTVISCGKCNNGYFVRTVEFNPFPIERFYTELSYGESPTEYAKAINEYIKKGYIINLIF